MLTRRDFLRLCMSSALTISLTDMLIPVLQGAYAQGQTIKPPVIWLELGFCNGNSISLENAVNPGFDQFLKEMIELRYHTHDLVVQGEQAVNVLSDTLEKDNGRFWLVVEGAVMTAANGGYQHVFLRNGKPVTGLTALQEIAPKAKYIIAVGDCACYGGPAAAHPNPAGAKGVWEIVKGKPVINIPGCPAHPDWMTGTFSHLLLYGMPQLDDYNRPKMFFNRTIHELCIRRQQFEDGIFASFPGDQGCLYKVGCKGPITYADCPLRQWNHYVNWPVKAGTPCIGCASPQFPEGMMPFYNQLPNIHTTAATMKVKKIGVVFATLGMGAVGTHLITRVFARRTHKHNLGGTKSIDPSPPATPQQLKQELDDIIRKQNALLAEGKKLQAPKVLRKRKSWLRQLITFWRTKDKQGK